MDRPLPALTVIVLNYRGAGATLRCVESLAAASYDGDLEILIVENGSGDDSRARLEAAAARCPRRSRVIASERNLGYAGGVNLAWPEVTTEFACLLNNDAFVHPECLRRLVEALRARPDLGAVWPYDAPASWRERLAVPAAAAVALLRNGTSSVTGANIWLPLLKDYRECFVGSGVCLVLRRAQVERPFLDEYFAYYEDVYLGWRLRLRGLASERVPEAVIYHEGSAVSRDDASLRPTLFFHAEKNRIANLLLCYEGRTLLALAPLLAADELVRLAGGLARAWRPRGAVLLVCLVRARCWVMSHLAWIARERRRVQAERVVSDRAIVPLLSGRLTARQGPAARLLNAAAVAYCRLVGLRVVETRAAVTPAR